MRSAEEVGRAVKKAANKARETALPKNGLWCLLRENKGVEKAHDSIIQKMALQRGAHHPVGAFRRESHLHLHSRILLLVNKGHQVMTMFVGATGPLVIALIRTFQLSPMSTVATNSVCLCLQHSLKIAAFGLLGFGFGPYLGIISLMIILGFLGTFLGKQVLLKTPPERFDLVLKIILSVLAVRLLIAP